MAMSRQAIDETERVRRLWDRAAPVEVEHFERSKWGIVERATARKTSAAS
jgi:hypothetical protein